jgi:hypothetical protein
LRVVITVNIWLTRSESAFASANGDQPYSGAYSSVIAEFRALWLALQITADALAMISSVSSGDISLRVLEAEISSGGDPFVSRTASTAISLAPTDRDCQ